MWLTLENKAFCTNSSSAFVTIFNCFNICRYQLTADIESKGEFVKHEATLALTSMIRASLMLPLDLEDMAKIKRYIHTFLPSQEQLTVAYHGIEEFERESRKIMPSSNYHKIYWLHQIDLQLYIFIYHIRRAQLHHSKEETKEAVSLLEIWLGNIYKSQLLYLYGLQNILEEIIQHYIYEYTKGTKRKNTKSGEKLYDQAAATTDDDTSDEPGIITRPRIAEYDTCSDETSAKDTEPETEDIRCLVYSRETIVQAVSNDTNLQVCLGENVVVASSVTDNILEERPKDTYIETKSMVRRTESSSQEIPKTDTTTKLETERVSKRSKDRDIATEESVSLSNSEGETDNSKGILDDLGDAAKSSDSDV